MTAASTAATMMDRRTDGRPNYDRRTTDDDPLGVGDGCQGIVHLQGGGDDDGIEK